MTELQLAAEPQVTEPQVFLVARPSIEWDGIRDYLDQVDEQSMPELPASAAWADRPLSPSDGEVLVEFGGRLCYKSWADGVNPNVTRTRKDSAEYLRNILASAHGSVLEHAQYSFVLANVSRVATHELARHRVGVAISQESLRFVRLTNIPFWMPDWAYEDPILRIKTLDLLRQLEDHQVWMADHFGLEDEGVSFAEKKAKTSFMRRMAPEGVGTALLWSANVRTLRWVVEARTAPHAEEEIRLIFHKVAQIANDELPNLFGDFSHQPVEGSDVPAWVPATRKV